ncbi:Hypothetical protein A7982_07156 [Minicystis rosea]|nr:Hypothetical protein A7982_07156 [Minicystis rosea]
MPRILRHDFLLFGPRSGKGGWMHKRISEVPILEVTEIHRPIPGWAYGNRTRLRRVTTCLLHQMKNAHVTRPSCRGPGGRTGIEPAFAGSQPAFFTR